MDLLITFVAATAFVAGAIVLAGDACAARVVRRSRLTLTLPTIPPPRPETSVPLRRWRAAATTRQVDAALASWLDACVRAAQSGATLRGALRDGAQSISSPALRAHLAPFVAAVDGGDSLAGALREFGEGSSSLTSLRRVLRLAASVGGPSAPVLDAVAATMHERDSLRRELRALSSSARASALLMAVAPAAFALIASMVDPRVGVFFVSLAGGVCLLAGLALEAGGVWWMFRIVRSVQ
jgi:tight adherence protein B